MLVVLALGAGIIWLLVKFHRPDPVPVQRCPACGAELKVTLEKKEEKK
jgi:hypothetical protein